ncbi:hypothetical protein POVCU2_0021150 [Plasmodium ovale curtisi]|uniref:Uncharacterized protein n=1 Tax=Plasmodium ovale curtisi TaxID=864141 RepID=A0A1A8VSH1_PLAOA|nr:hypothetical protein POVCU2_0021150 [Plasmodium ovale curtisi]
MCIYSGHQADMLRIDKYNYNARGKWKKQTRQNWDAPNIVCGKGNPYTKGGRVGLHKANVTGKERHEKEIKCKVMGDE